MEYLGLFCLGVFAGAIATLGLRFIKDVDQWQKALAVVLPAVLSGLAMVVVDRFKYSPALGSYPLGLVVALMWAYIDTAVMNVTALRGSTMPDQAATKELKAEYDTLAWKRRIGFAHLGAATLITSAAAVLTVIPAWLQIEAELEITPQQRKEILLDERRKASLGVAPKNATTGGQPTSATSITLPASTSKTQTSTSEKK